MAGKNYRSHLDKINRRIFCAGITASALYSAAGAASAPDAAAPPSAEAPPGNGKAVLTPPTITGPIPVSETSKPYGTSLAPGSYSAGLMKEYDYVEEEYFISGYANIYGPGVTKGLSALTEGEKRTFVVQKMKALGGIFRAEMPYRTRVLLARPRSNAKFSGRVHLYVFHNLFVQVPVERHLLENGDAIAGLEGCSGTRFGPQEIPSGGIAHLHKVDLQRYRDLRFADASPTAWPDLTPGTLGAASKNLSFAGTSSSSDIFLQEIYRSYAQAPDILTQVAHALKMGNPTFPFGTKVRSLFNFAASGGSTFLQPYIDFHHEAGMLPDGRPPFDGYLIMVGLLPQTKPKGAVFVYLNSEADLATSLKMGTVFPPDSDTPPIRIYEIPGTGHSLSAPLPEVSAALGAQMKEAAKVVPEGIAGISDRGTPPEGVLPYDKINSPIMWGVWANMYAWIEKGIAMPRAPRITRDPNATDGIARDDHGNALGGLRTPWVDVPDATYVSRFSPKDPLRAGMKPFPQDKMQRLYGSREHYLALVNQKIDAMVKNRWIKAEHASAMRLKA